MLHELGVGHARVLRAMAADDAGFERAVELATQLTEKLRRSYEYQARKVPGLAQRLELTNKEPRKVVLPPVLVGVAAMSVLSAVLAAELAIKAPRLTDVHGLKQSSVAAVGDQNPRLRHGLP